MANHAITPDTATEQERARRMFAASDEWVRGELDRLTATVTADLERLRVDLRQGGGRMVNVTDPILMTPQALADALKERPNDEALRAEYQRRLALRPKWNNAIRALRAAGAGI